MSVLFQGSESAHYKKFGSQFSGNAESYPGNLLPGYDINFPDAPLAKTESLIEEYTFCNSKYIKISGSSPFTVKSVNNTRPILIVFSRFGAFDYRNTSIGSVESIDCGEGIISCGKELYSSNDLKYVELMFYYLPISTMAPLLEHISHAEHAEISNFSEKFIFTSGRYASLLRLVEVITETIRSEALSNHECRAFEDAIATRILYLMPSGAHSADEDQGSDTPRVLYLAEEFLRSHTQEQIALEDVAKAADCSTRTLQRVFQEKRGAGPMHILTRMRLAAAHAAIEDGLLMSVTELALSLQFSNPGRFAGVYKEYYGVSPAAAIRMKLAERQATTLQTRSRTPKRV